mgnify:CR=1 FL=1
MSETYNKYYQTENLFGEPYPELIEFFQSRPVKGRLLDLGCGQGRDAVALAKLGYEVTGIDSSKVGIDQLNAVARNEHLTLRGVVGDIYAYGDFGLYDYILMDSMFHFRKPERAKEMGLLQRIFEESKQHAIITICIQDTGDKLEVLHSVVSKFKWLEEIHNTNLSYTFVDQDSGHRSITPYQMLSLKKH